MSVRYLGCETKGAGRHAARPDSSGKYQIKSADWLTFVGKAGTVALFKFAIMTDDCVIKAM